LTNVFAGAPAAALAAKRSVAATSMAVMAVTIPALTQKALAKVTEKILRKSHPARVAAKVAPVKIPGMRKMRTRMMLAHAADLMMKTAGSRMSIMTLRMVSVSAVTTKATKRNRKRRIRKSVSQWKVAMMAQSCQQASEPRV
jgi:hypothetical protein